MPKSADDLFDEINKLTNLNKLYQPIDRLVLCYHGFGYDQAHTASNLREAGHTEAADIVAGWTAEEWNTLVTARD